MPTTTPDYVSSVSLLPTLEFLELVGKKQWDSTVSYGLGISTIVTRFHSTTNSEWLCLNTEAEFLESPIGTISIKNPFEYNRVETSPIFVTSNDIKVPKNKLSSIKSLFLYRIADNGLEVITVTNYAKQDVTTAPLIDCFSRECLTWFSSSVDWFSGFGYSSQSLTPFVVNDDGIILTKSEEILSSLIIDSVAKIDYTNIQLVNTVSGSTPYASIQLSTGVQYTGTGTDKANSLFLYLVDKENDSLVAFAYGYPTPLSSVSYDRIVTDISFSSEDILII